MEVYKALFCQGRDFQLVLRTGLARGRGLFNHRPIDRGPKAIATYIFAYLSYR